MKHLWNRVGSEPVFDAGVFRLRADTYEYRGRGAAHPYYVLDSAPWVNIVPVTDTGEIVLVNQFRHGIEDWSLEIPGGLMDPEDADPETAAVREMLEETGFAARNVRPLLKVSSNPAILTNFTHSFVAEGAHRVADPTPDAGEELQVVIRPVAEIEASMADGTIHHSLSVAALCRWLLSRDT